ncbi:hypothetical protein K458DRAFT_315808 [Lentithecium fluviatile CBS 122367]|uniref:DUF3176 domain-containing protein n=1 Tax=Lentithecium fluviatile CBS 122367 TaxID=1168545 RepID=A0A6G1IL81_9PLEO|nr:hypothetical protein K458DRAFT_315808 [Lentithecium fluviatile CBS 122367]
MTNFKQTTHSSSSAKATAVTTEATGPQLDRKAGLPRDGTWASEIMTLAIGIGAVASIIGVIARYNESALPDWPYDITLNALIALLATIANATMSVTLSTGLSQSKWIRFRQAATPLSDMEDFDEASRGSWGAVKLLATAKGGVLGSFGAIVAIIGLALGPFAQQIATYKIRNVESDAGAIVPRALNYTGALPGNSSTGFVPILPLKAAVYNGLFAENNRPAASLSFTCQSGNCAWEPFESLAICHECTDISSLVTRYCPPELGLVPNASSCGWQVPQGAHLNTSSDVFGMTSFIPSAYGDMTHATLIRIVFMGTEAHDKPDELNPWAKLCSLQACVNTLSSSVVNGTLEENITHTVLNGSMVDMSSPDQDSDYGVYISGDSGDPYLLGMGALLSIRGWFSAIFTNGSATRTTTDFIRSITDPDRAVVVNLTVGISSGETFFDTDILTAFYWNYYEYADGLDMLMSDLAVSMTTAVRGFKGAVPVNGKSISIESYVHVRWGFAVLPIAVVVLTLVFLLGSMVMTHSSGAGLWKSSALVSLFHGLDEGTREIFDAKDNLVEKKKQAKKVRVQLYINDRDETLLGTEQSY